MNVIYLIFLRIIKIQIKTLYFILFKNKNYFFELKLILIKNLKNYID